jgi:flagellar hook-length control protein FliK
MQTPLILNSTTPLQQNAPAAKKGADAAPATQFNQVLSQQIKDRPHGSENKHEVHEKTNAPMSKPASSTAKTVAKSSSVDKEKTRDTTDDSDETTEPLTNAPTDLIALVAQAVQFGQSNTKTADPDTSSSEQAETTLGVDGITKNSGEHLGAANSLAQFAATLAVESGSKNDVPVNQHLQQDDLLNVTAEEAFEELSAAGKKQEILPELPASAKAQEALSNLAMPPGHQIPLDTLQSVGGSRPTEKLSPHVGTPAWDQALGQKIVWMVGGAQQTASLSLNPPDLGPLQVVLNVSNDQANATFISAQPEVRQAIEAALPKLREMMGEAGIQLGQTNVNAGSGSQQEQSFGEQNRPSPSSFSHGKDVADIPVGMEHSAASVIRQGLVNTFA